MPRDPYRYFRLEGRELLDQFGQGILELERGGSDAAVLQRLLRLAHTLKGAARIVKQQEIADRAHAIEDALSPFRESSAAVAREQIDTVLQHLGEIGQRLQTLNPVGGSDVPAQGKPAAEEGVRLVRADVTEIDAVLDGVLEAHALLNGLRGSTRAIEQTQRLVDILLAELAAGVGTEHGGQRRFSAEHVAATAAELRRGVVGLERNLGSAIDQMDRELRQLRDTAEQLRLVAASTLFTALERTARDTAQALFKEVRFDGTGGDIRLDSHVLATVQGALTQIVRNAVAHGTESETERRSLGKPRTGRVHVDVFRRGRRIVFKCHDDGRGLDFAAVQRIAVRRGLLGANAGELGAEELVRLLLRGGISTSRSVTEVSGRGIGLDIVREALDRLGGEVIVRTEPRQGTTFELVVPPSLLSTDALMVTTSATAAAIPLDAVRGSIRVAAAEISTTARGMSVLYGRSAIPFVPLSKALDGARPAAGRNWTAAVVEGSGGLAAFGVDRLLGTARVVVRPLPEHAHANAVVAGVFLDAEGNPQLVLDPDGLVTDAYRAEDVALEQAPPRRPVLVVDDSLTTRMLEQSILESAGYEVDVALSGEEALESARRKRYALFLVDVEMPGMDGFSFIRHVRADPAIHDVPAILVTSRAAAEDRQRGRDVGAQGYIVKSEFNQVELLTLIRPLMG
ncbi:MAG: response regulator [Roseiarcus sp.]|jgi:two-component system chemotaxis sensor kinase CheA